MSNKKQTAIDFFVEKLVELKIGKDHYEGQREDLQKAYLEAKELEKQQIIDARQDGFNKCFRKGDRKEISNEQYFKQTYENG